VASVITGDGVEPLSKRRYLASELRRVRDLAGISGRELAQRIGVSQSKVSRIESGTALPSIPEVRAWTAAAEASTETVELLIALTEAAFTEVHTWRTIMQGRTHMQDDIQELENRADIIRTFQPSVIPGLLQTAEYARRVLTLFQPPYAESDIPAAVGARLDRQLALFEEHRKFEFLITEAALRWRPGPPVLLQAQFDRIISLSTLSNLSIGLIPHAVRAVACTSHAFVIFALRDENPSIADDTPEDEASSAVVTVETVHANLTVSDPDSVALYRSRWHSLEQMAVYGDEARAFLTGVGRDIQASEL
jgi:transcriptional regulator with XRE-family HTH domain